MLICLKCEEIYDERIVSYKPYKHNRCPKQNCTGNLVDIDELFVPIILQLNKKGYTTKYCCSGHLHQNGCGVIASYISFKEFVILDDLINVIDEDWIYDEHNRVIRKYFEGGLKKEGLLYEITKNANDLLLSVSKLGKAEHISIIEEENLDY